MHAYGEKRPCLLSAARYCKTFSLLPFFADPAAEPVKPSWKNILMIAIMARWPLANQAFNFAVIRPMPFRCAKVTPVSSMRPQKATIWSQPASGTVEKATEPPGLLESLVSVFGDRQPSSLSAAVQGRLAA